MATLIIPTKAYGVRNKKGKYHLQSGLRRGTTACGTEWGCSLKVALGGEIDIAELKPEQLCKKCLGAMKAVKNRV